MSEGRLLELEQRRRRWGSPTGSDDDGPSGASAASAVSDDGSGMNSADDWRVQGDDGEWPLRSRGAQGPRGPQGQSDSDSVDTSSGEEGDENSTEKYVVVSRNGGQGGRGLWG